MQKERYEELEKATLENGLHIKEMLSCWLAPVKECSSAGSSAYSGETKWRATAAISVVSLKAGGKMI